MTKLRLGMTNCVGSLMRLNNHGLQRINLPQITIFGLNTGAKLVSSAQNQLLSGGR
jgi:hypothetical protein